MDVETALRDQFGLESLRPWQSEAISALLSGPGRVLVVAPTGGGKSLCYQLPAVCLPGTALVISPLVSLMEDQVRGLLNRGISATYLASTLDARERALREGLLVSGRYRLVYVAPERLASDTFLRLLLRAEIGLVAVDEAHCISHWGHDFRPDYLRISALIARLRPRRVLACTATATPEVRSEIAAHLGFNDANSCVVLRGFARPNLHLSAMHTDGRSEAQALAKRHLEAALPRGGHGGGIVYVATRKVAEQTATLVHSKRLRAAAYHAGMDPSERVRVSHEFADGTLDVVVATNAFGMGIDRPDVRTVIHLQPSASIEAYYQEVGRAGRDGKPATGLLLCSAQDIVLRKRLIELDSEGERTTPEKAERAWRLFRELLRYLDASSCRHDFMLRYFGDEQELLGGCGHCDQCLRIGEESDGVDDETRSLVVRKALSGVARAERRAGMLAIAEMLAGVPSERQRRLGLTHLSTFGILADYPPTWIASLLRGMLAAGWIDLTTTLHPVPYLTKDGGAVLRGQRAPSILFPRNGRSSRSQTKPSRLRARPRPEPSGHMLERLRAARHKLARELGVPAYVVATDRILLSIVERKPRSLRELLDVKGMGEKRVAAYGDALLAAALDP